MSYRDQRLHNFRISMCLCVDFTIIQHVLNNWFRNLFVLSAHVNLVAQLLIVACYIELIFAENYNHRTLVMCAKRASHCLNKSSDKKWWKIFLLRIACIVDIPLFCNLNTLNVKMTNPRNRYHKNGYQRHFCDCDCNIAMWIVLYKYYNL